MQVTREDMRAIFEENIWIDVSEEQLQIAKKKAYKYNNPTAQSNVYLNQICLDSFLSWLKQERELTEKVSEFNFWEVVTGSVVIVEGTRLILLPSMTVDIDEIIVPQEWVDIPEWAGNYYLGVQVNLEEKYICIWGYASHQTLKKQGRFDPIYRNYSLEQEDMISDLDLIWIAKDMCGGEKLAIEPLGNLKEAKAESLIDRLSKSLFYSPRLEVSFEEWAGLLKNELFRDKLQKALLKPALVPIKNYSKEVEKSFTNLSQWLKNNFTESQGWQLVENFMSPTKLQLSFKNRQNLMAMVKRAKLVKLNYDGEEYEFIVLVSVTPEAEEKLGVSVQLHPYGKQTHLQGNLKLALLAKSKQVLQKTVSREHDIYIALKDFNCPKETFFSIQIAFNDVNIVEDFWFENL